MDRDQEIRKLRERLAALESQAADDRASTSAEPPIFQASRPAGRDRAFHPAYAIVPGAVFACVLFVLLAGGIGGEMEPSVDAGEPVAPAPAPLPPTWVYYSSQDEMAGQPAKFACVESSNTVSLQWPYGEVAGRLCLRDSPRHGVDVMVSLQDRGQILCRSYDGCTISVKFDEGAVQRFSAVGPSSLDSDMVFLTNTSRFIRSAQSAAVTRVELEFYEAGSQAFVFPTADLVWPRP
jgi:hypothetical protein